jgi:hypothetical protein
MNGAASASETVNWDAVMIEDGQTEGLWTEGCIVLPTNMFMENPNFEDPYTGTAGGSAIVGRSAAWAAHGASCISVIPVSSNLSSALPAGPATSAGAAMLRLGGLIPGRVYTISVDAYMPTTQTGSPAADARRITIKKRAVGGAITALAESNVLSNTAGAQARLVVTFTVPSPLEDIEVRLVNGSAIPTEIVYFDAVMVEEGATSGEWTEGFVGA